MNITIFISMLFCLQLFYWLVARRSSKNITGKEDYFLAGKSVRLFPLMMTFLATQVGGGVILGSADEAYRFGWPVLLYPLGAALGLILLGCGVGRKLASFQVSTIAQILEIVYGSVVLRKIASILSIVSLFMILVAQIIASSKFLVSLGFSSTPLFILFWSIVIIYTAQGGLRAVISTDMVQAALFFSVFLFCFGFVLFFEPSVSLIQMPHLTSFASVSSKLCGWLLMPLLFMIIEQDMGQRCFAGASPKIVSRASLLAGIGTMIVCVVPVFLGCLANVTGLEVVPGGSVLMAMIAKTTNPWITSLVGCAVLAAIISTATSLINAISSNLSGDFKLSFLQRIDSMRVVKGITCLISIGSIFFAFYFDNIVDLLIQSYELSVSCLFIPIIMALFKKEGNFSSALMAMILGTTGFFLFRIYPIDFPKEIASILLSIVGYVLGEAFTRYRLKIADRISP
jgi:SSS family solute:Na+ symporter